MGDPRGLRGEEIPLAARIFSIADSFDAMTSDRPYRRALPLERALEEIREGAGTQFDPAVVRAFLELVETDERFPAVQRGADPPNLRAV
jgi:HD-GYP domain-containing protein (c-di-GMP phosphodiesterase class II)